MERKLTFAAVIPTRGIERKVFLSRQRERAQQLGFDEVIVVDYEPLDNNLDLFQRLAVGFSKAFAMHIDFVSVIEDDDYYALDYLDHVKAMAGKTVDIIGFDRTTYYHLKTGGYRFMSHAGRSSLFSTTVATKRFNSFEKVVNNPYIDLEWWKQSRNMIWRLSDKEPFLGIKHGIGKLGGNGHRAQMYNTHDTICRSYLKSRVDKESFEFYQNIIKEL